MTKLNLGVTCVTAGIAFLCAADSEFKRFVDDSLHRYKNFDWGDICDADKRQNDEDVISGEQILAMYRFSDEVKIYIISEWDRQATTICFPDER